MDLIDPTGMQIASAGKATTGQRLARGGLATLLVLLGLYTLRNFLPALAWAAIFAIALWPTYMGVHAKHPGKHNVLVPAAFTLAVALVFLVPVALVGVAMGNESHSAADWLRDAQQHGVPAPDFLGRLPYGSEVAGWWNENLGDPNAAKRLLGRIDRGAMMNYSRDVGAHVLHGLMLFFFTLMSLFFLFKEGETVNAQFRRVSHRAFGPSGERVAKQMVASVHGTVNGLVLVGLGEGVLLGFVYFFAGLPHPTIFGVLTAVAAMIPFATAVVFVLAGGVLLAQGSTIAAIIVVLAGFATTFVADHFIRPVLIGGATKLPFIWVLLGILGGVEMWGLMGLFLGPAIMAALILLWREWADPQECDNLALR